VTSIAVVGSANLDLVVRADRFPGVGETVTGSSFDTGVGGKGLNQAVAAARLGGQVSLLCAVGDDDAGRQVRDTVADAGVAVAGVRVIGEPTGTAHITVDAAGDNMIVVVPGANAVLTSVDDDERSTIGDSGIVLSVLEIPLSRVIAAFAAARSAGARTVLTPAPVQALPDELVRLVDLLVLNASEAQALGRDTTDAIPEVVVTAGADGSTWRGPDGAIRHVPAPEVEVVDTTGAGDCFTGALAVALAEGRSMPDALVFATAAAAQSVRRRGAAAGMPTRAELPGWPRSAGGLAPSGDPPGQREQRRGQRALHQPAEQERREPGGHRG
jgi:ribokinase